MKIKSMVKLLCPLIIFMTGCDGLFQQSISTKPEPETNTLSAGTQTAAIEEGTWWTMNAQSYDVAIGSREWIYIINNAYNPYYWAWKTGTFAYGNPAGGSWVPMATIPSGFSRIASSQSNVVVAVGRDGNAYQFNGSGWNNLGQPPCGGSLDIAVSPAGVISVVSTGGCGGIYDWSGTKWLQYVEEPWLKRLAPALTGGKVATNTVDNTTIKFYPRVWSPLKSQDLGGADERQQRRSLNTYELWRTDMDGNIFHLYSGLWPNGTVEGGFDSRWLQTTGRASNIAASKYSDLVVIQGSNRNVYLSTDFSMR